MQSNQQPRIGVSGCLLGESVRFDGGHKRHPLVTRLAEGAMELLPLCPEMAIGLGTPRPAIQLREVAGTTRLVNSRNPAIDLTGQMNSHAHEAVEGLGGLDGFIFKKGSPSCGMERVPVVVNEQGYRRRNGRGLFAAAFMARWPLIPTEEEGRLNDTAIRDNFFERIYAYRRWKAIASPESNVAGFIEFHARHKLQLMARGPHLYRELGRLVAGTTRATLSERRTAYISRFMEVMATRPGRRQHVNVLQHIQGYLKRRLDSDDKRELERLFEAFRDRQVPLVAPLTLLRHHLRRHTTPYLEAQHYLAPYPEPLLQLP